MEITIEKTTTFRNGQMIELHRCKRCVRAVWFATNTTQDDNGWIPTDRTIQHFRDCPERTN